MSRAEGLQASCISRTLAAGQTATFLKCPTTFPKSRGGLPRCLDSLFQHTPPTALLLIEARLFIAAQQHLARMGKVAPRDVSLICDDPDIAFSWCDPPVSHIRWDTRPVVNRMVRWADRVARGEEDKTQRSTLAEFVEGGTIGPVRSP